MSHVSEAFALGWYKLVNAVPRLQCQHHCMHRSGQERPSAYQKEDIWVLSSDPSCQVAAGGAGVRGTMHQGWVLLARSSWHGPNKEGRYVHLLSFAV